MLNGSSQSDTPPTVAANKEAVPTQTGPSGVLPTPVVSIQMTPVAVATSLAAAQASPTTLEAASPALANPALTNTPDQQAAIAKAMIKESKPSTPKVYSPSTIIEAKQAYRAGRITKERYREVVTRLEDEFDMRVRQAKLDYKAARITKEGYKMPITQLKRRYIGED